MALCTCSPTCFGGQVKRIPCAQEFLGCIVRKRKTNLHILKPNWALQRLSVKITSEWMLFQCSLFHETHVSLCLAWLWISCWSGFCFKISVRAQTQSFCTQCSWSTTWSHPIHSTQLKLPRGGMAVSRTWPTGSGHCWLRTSSLLFSLDSRYCKHCLSNSRFWLSIIGQRYPDWGWGWGVIQVLGIGQKEWKGEFEN